MIRNVGGVSDSLKCYIKYDYMLKVIDLHKQYWFICVDYKKRDLSDVYKNTEGTRLIKKKTSMLRTKSLAH